MTPSPIIETYWRFAAERQAIFFGRYENPSGPWTNDPILRTYRFTNAYRASDRVSQFLIREVQYSPDRSQDPGEIVFRTLLFKIFNKIETWKLLEEKLGPIAWSKFDASSADKILSQQIELGRSIYSAAYIMPSPKFGHRRKHSNHLALLKQIMDDKIHIRFEKSKSLGEIYQKLLQYSGIGKFLAFQYAIDLNYSSFLTLSESDFVVAGPGALDGISKCFKSLGKRSPEEVILRIADEQDSYFSKFGVTFRNLYGRKLQPIDCQNLFCEVSKYTRISHPNITGIADRRRIKQMYQPHSAPLPLPYFPPTWKINAAADTKPQKREPLAWLKQAASFLTFFR